MRGELSTASDSARTPGIAVAYVSLAFSAVVFNTSIEDAGNTLDGIKLANCSCSSRRSVRWG